MDVKIVELESLHVASVLAYGPEPETMAMEKLQVWKAAHGLAGLPSRTFGFNNPDPSVGSPQYGYEFWETVSSDVKPDETVTIQEFGGGKYAVTRCVGVQHITDQWMELVRWAEQNGVQQGSHQWLEEHLHFGPDVPPDEMVLDLFMPIRG